MQDTDADVISNQRKRRKRIGRIKTGIVLTITGWILLSMILIIVLLVKTASLERKVEQLMTRESTYSSVSKPTGDAGEAAVEPQTEATEEPAGQVDGLISEVPEVTGTDDPENMAEAGDIHKVYLTFDNGPSENTSEILEILAEYGVKATFFVTGNEDEEAQELYKRIVEEGHTLGMHSFCNKYSVLYQSEESFEKDYNELHDYLYELTGVDSVYYRFPGGSSNHCAKNIKPYIRYVNKKGLLYFDWNALNEDAVNFEQSPKQLNKKILKDVRRQKTSIVLMHDLHETTNTVKALDPLIKTLKKEGYQILPITKNTKPLHHVSIDK